MGITGLIKYMYKKVPEYGWLFTSLIMVQLVATVQKALYPDNKRTFF